MPNPPVFRRPLAALLALGLIASCSASGENLGEPRPELGNFRLCYNIVTTNDAVQGPLSREADLDAFAELLRSEVNRRFGRYQGDRLYHLAMHIDAYVLAVPGIPLVASPRSALITSVNVWSDALGRPLNEEPEQFTVLESAGAGSVIGSGLTQSAEQQMQQLTRNAALRIEDWLASHPEWFEDTAEPAEDLETTTTAEAPETDPCAYVPAQHQTTQETPPEAAG
ncbi:MAG: hypothetical protein Kow0013_27670 [Pararhodobacter sp.]